MAYSLRITGIGTDGTETLRMEPHWWDISKLGEHVKLRWVTTNATGSYSDDAADVAAGDCRKLHELFRPALLEKIASNEECIQANKPDTEEFSRERLSMYEEYGAELESTLQTLDLAFGSEAGKFAGFHLCLFEWDSGL